VDHVSHAIVRLVVASRARNRTFHVFDPRSLAFSRLWEALRAAGARVREVPYPEFWQALRAVAGAPDADRDLRALLSLLPAPGPRGLEGSFADANRRFSLHRTAAALRDVGVEWPQPLEPALAAYAAHQLSTLAPSAAAG
ncbi:MAG TPA: hypothetical protein VFX28_11765, partial [Methylomirabilota bacterium]|nr:hypothetical protein [Methylomirabilota bacterium]